MHELVLMYRVDVDRLAMLDNLSQDHYQCLCLVQYLDTDAELINIAYYDCMPSDIISPIQAQVIKLHPLVILEWKIHAWVDTALHWHREPMILDELLCYIMPLKIQTGPQQSQSHLHHSECSIIKEYLPIKRLTPVEQVTEEDVKCIKTTQSFKQDFTFALTLSVMWHPNHIQVTQHTLLLILTLLYSY